MYLIYIFIGFKKVFFVLIYLNLILKTLKFYFYFDSMDPNFVLNFNDTLADSLTN